MRPDTFTIKLSDLKIKKGNRNFYKLEQKHIDELVARNFEIANVKNNNKFVNALMANLDEINAKLGLETDMKKTMNANKKFIFASYVINYYVHDNGAFSIELTRWSDTKQKWLNDHPLLQNLKPVFSEISKPDIKIVPTVVFSKNMPENLTAKVQEYCNTNLADEKKIIAKYWTKNGIERIYLNNEGFDTLGYINL